MNTYYYSTLALCGLLGELSTSFFLQVCAFALALVVALGRVIIENLCTYDH